MKKFETIRSRLTAGLPWFVLFLFLFQPVMDCISFWTTQMEWSNAPMLLLRFGVLGVTVLLGFGLSHRKWIYWVAAAVCLVSGAGHVYAL